ncbi:MAG: hypothetical protein IT330_05495 [Anaerolineae bacterium]|nr:hypothetical protein [Anaerolineae bacterium]
MSHWYVFSARQRAASAFVRIFGALFLAITALISPATGPVFAETTVPADTPTPVVNDIAEEWAVGGGLLYWANSCFAEEFPPPSTIKRRPVAGGTIQTLEQTQSDNCLTYLNIAAANDGVYYYDDAQDRLERIPTGPPFTPRVIVNVPDNQRPTDNSTLKVAGNHVYWVSFNAGAVFRARRNGTGNIETVVNGINFPSDVIVVGNTIYYTENGGSNRGVWFAQNDCATLPCNSSKVRFSPFAANGSGHSILDRRGTFRFTYVLEWVERTGSESKIRRRTCTDFAVCLNPAVDFYTASTNWFVGNLVTDGTNMFWTERFSSISTPDGKLRRKPLGTGNAEDITPSIPGIDRRLAIANGNIYFAVDDPSPFNQFGIYFLPLNASAILRDLTADAWEITQGIQNLANAVPLVAGKTTYVRVYGTELSGPNATNVDARLSGTRNGVPLPGSPLMPLNGLHPLNTGGTYDRDRLNDGWLFLLPASWTTTGGIALRAEVDPQQGYTDPNRANNVLASNITFQNQPPVCVWTVPVRTHTPRPSTTDPNFWEMVNRFEQRWPVPDVWVYRDTNPVEELQVCWAGPFPYPCYGPYELEDGWGITNGIPDRDKVIFSLWLRAQTTFNPDECDDIGAPVHFMGMVHPDANNGGAAGYASTISNQSWVQLPPHLPNPAPADWFRVDEGSTMAQELAHNQGRKHVDCGNPDNVDNNYPYPPCQIANVGADSYYGFHGPTQTPIRPNEAADFMSYAGRTWVSDYTWRALFNAFSAANVKAVTPRVLDATDVVFAAGYIDMAINQGKLGYLLGLPQVTLPTQALAGSAAIAQADHEEAPHAVYRLRLLDADGAVLHEEMLVPAIIDDHDPISDPALFQTTFAPPAGQVAQVQLLADDTVIDSISSGHSKPSLAIQQPANGVVISDTLAIQWTASDPDPGDQLLFTVQYSYNGGVHWHTLVNDFPSSSTISNTLSLADLGSLHGSTGQTAIIRVIASDGYNTAIANSQLFSVVNRPPDVFITSPGNGQSVPAEEPVMLSGGATDAEDGGLGSAALSWRMDDAAAGTGADVAVDGLAPGAHTARLTATDSVSNTSAISATFQIAPLGIPLAATPTLDGFCDDNAYGSGVEVRLAPYGNGGQASARLLRTGSDLWACFSGLKKGAVAPGAFAGLRVDTNNSRDALAQTDDYGFFAGENGDVTTTAGNGAGGFAGTGPGGVQAQVSSGATTWNAELQIDGSVLGGLDHLIGLKLGHDWVGFSGDDYAWPYLAIYNQPDTWAVTTLGTLPSLTSLDPFTAIFNGSAFTMTVEGTGLVSGTVVLWNSTPLPTTFVDTEHLIAEVGAAQLSSAAAVTVTARSPAPANFVSNGLPFEVYALPPTISSVSPDSIQAGSPMITLTVNGANFAQDAQVLWNGEALTTTWVSSNRLTARVAAARLADGQTVGITVRNRTPEEQISPQVTFEVLPPKMVYLPYALRAASQR